MNHCHETGVYDRYSHRGQMTYCATIVNRKSRDRSWFRQFNGYFSRMWRQTIVSRAVSWTNEPVLFDVTGGCSHSSHTAVSGWKQQETLRKANNARYAFPSFNRKSAEWRNWFCAQPVTPALLQVKIIVRKLQLVVPLFASIFSHGNVLLRPIIKLFNTGQNKFWDKEC